MHVQVPEVYQTLTELLEVMHATLVEEKISNRGEIKDFVHKGALTRMLSCQSNFLRQLDAWPLLSALLSKSMTFCRGMVLFFLIEFLKHINLMREARLDQSQLFSHESKQVWLVKTAFHFLICVHYMGSVDIE